ncbi:hypothetical protein NKH49_32890 [Mesorhizobium sp. M1088]|uniref:hypothetical protein n=1 Tax=Mesorhizobium sp. M1088 TaxID=2957056 RepID=UPI003337E347
MILGLQALVSRGTDPLESLVISVTKLNAGTAYNIIPDHAEICGTVRTLAPGLRDFAERQILAADQGIARGFGGDVELKYRRLEPVTFNHTAETNVAIKAARSLVGLPPWTTTSDHRWGRRISPTCSRRDRGRLIFARLPQPLSAVFDPGSMSTSTKRWRSLHGR